MNDVRQQGMLQVFGSMLDQGLKPFVPTLNAPGLVRHRKIVPKRMKAVRRQTIQQTEANLQAKRKTKRKLQKASRKANRKKNR